ncbi:hypothetical protein A3D77_07810 [Candidatus Gottesmanbacteria bacterium RIFCSPHIGHO2_02_FULL_39_11]|uniref:Uncharacterized protein n=1 Tax=Candidatus Gottesmanbacteria bacterium RIFCSPHIGHO2_02_FULL_39_11 TaxID=1798382 RepID=A0A1F5ZTJ9_9BACT|nr:MAG: hypothetical protein A3D77_07810 [Candidatus Gottesmanbacteria bacterium RIFCSPHIGHO2_02_FULL_39_11]
MDNTNSNQPENISASPPPINPEPVVATAQTPPIDIPPANKTNNSYKTFIIIGIILTILASVGIAGTAIATYITRTKNAENQIVKIKTIPTAPPQNTMVDNSAVRAQMIKEVVLTDEDPTRPGIPVEKKTEFTKKTESIYATVILNNPIVGSKISYVRYLNSNYMDHGTIIVTKSDSKYVHFSFTLANQKAFQPVGSYLLKLYVDGQVVKTAAFTVTN